MNAKTKVKKLKQLAQDISNGNLTDVSSVITFEPQKMTFEDYQALLEIAKYQGFGVKTLESEIRRDDVQNEKKLDLITKIGGLLTTGKYAAVLENVINADDVELQIEKARALILLSEYEKAKKVVEPIIDSPAMKPNTRGVAHQLLGAIYSEMNEDSKALSHLKISLDIANGLGNFSGAFSCYLYLVRNDVWANDLSSAQTHLSKAKEILKKTPSLRLMLGYLRSRLLIELAQNQIASLDTAKLTLLVAAALQDSTFINKTLLEMAVMKKALLNSSELTFLNSRTQKKSTYESEVFEYLESNTVGSSRTLKWFAAISNSDNVFSKVCIESFAKAMNEFSWALDIQLGLVVDVPNAIVSNIGHASRPLEICKLVNQRSGIEEGELFETIWGLKWSKERNDVLLSVNLNRCSKIIPSMHIFKKDKRVYIQSSGFVSGL